MIIIVCVDKYTIPCFVVGGGDSKLGREPWVESDRFDNSESSVSSPSNLCTAHLLRTVAFKISKSETYRCQGLPESVYVMDTPPCSDNKRKDVKETVSGG